MESKIAPIWRHFESSIAGRLTAAEIATWKAVFYAGAFACAWRIEYHLMARGKYDDWMAELMLEIDDAMHALAAAEFAEPEP